MILDILKLYKVNLMKRKCLVIGIILFFITTSIIPSFAQVCENPLRSGGTWLYVGGDGPGNYTTIRDAIHASSDGDTVFVYDDSSPYNENISIVHSIKLLGENPNSTIIHSHEYHIIDVLTNDVTVEGFCLSGSVQGIFIEANSCSITNNIIMSGGIHFYYTANNTITHNIILGFRGIGIGLTGTTHTLIENNSISGNFTGISALESSNILIINNRLSHITQAIMLLECSSANITNNVIMNATSFAIFLQDPTATNQIISNMVMSCYWGIFLWLSHYQLIKNNIILDSGLGIKLEESNHNFITHNFFQGNTVNAEFKESYQNKWRRNFWDYPRILPYIIIGTNVFHQLPLKWLNFDWFPAQEPSDSPGMD